MEIILKLELEKVIKFLEWKISNREVDWIANLKA